MDKEDIKRQKKSEANRRYREKMKSNIKEVIKEDIKEDIKVNTVLNTCDLPQTLREQIKENIKTESEKDYDDIMERKKRQPKKKDVVLDKYPLEDVDELTVEEFDKIIECEVRKRLREIERTTMKDEIKPKEPFFFPEKIKSSMITMITPLIVPFILQIGSRFLQDFATKSTQKVSNQPPILQMTSQPNAQIDIENHLAKFGMSSKPLS